jgi:hypothetical protein
MRKSKKYSTHLDLHIQDFERYLNYFKVKKINENEYLVKFII